jgi:rhodanese-related sulfurtransferase
VIERSHRTPFLLSLFLVATATGAADPSDDVFDLDRLRVKITENLPYIEARHGADKVLVMRHQDPGHAIESPYEKTSRDCPPFCVQPMTLAHGVETIGELELIEFLNRAASGDDSFLVIDSRSADWTARSTIPGSVNIPYTRLDPNHTPAQEIAEILELEMGVIRADGVWNFSTAKTLVLFCNGAWCGQSPTNIKALLNFGYPPHKLKWYRGGMQSWEQMGFTTVASDE